MSQTLTMQMQPPNSAIFENETYFLFREFVRDRTGILYSEPRRRIFENRILSRVRALGLQDPRAYYRYLTFHPDKNDEFLRLASVLTNNETFFFREVATLEAVVERAVAANKPRFRILSAGSSSGEELSTLAMLLKGRGLDLNRFELQGVDLDVNMVNTASSGVYRNKSFRNTDAETLIKYFSPEGEHRRLKRFIHDHLAYRWANLVDAATMRFPHPFDVILCRNVLIYFNQDTVKEVVHILHNLIAPDGILLTGVSESLAQLPFLFDPNREDGIVVYHKIDST